jgi:hypothetical protein
MRTTVPAACTALSLTAIVGCCVDDELGDCAMPALPAARTTPPDNANVPS